MASFSPPSRDLAAPREGLRWRTDREPESDRGGGFVAAPDALRVPIPMQRSSEARCGGGRFSPLLSRLSICSNFVAIRALVGGQRTHKRERSIIHSLFARILSLALWIRTQS